MTPKVLQPADDLAFRDAARDVAMKWKVATATLPDAARLPGDYKQYKQLPYCLPREFHDHNLLPNARDVALERFTAAGIRWHDGVENGPSNHLLDSQVQCVNALAPFVGDGGALAAVLGRVLPIAEVLPFGAIGGTGHLSDCDATDFVVFEWQGLQNHLHEWSGVPTRGSNATSADAAIRYRATDGAIELALIEWKFTERYPDGSLSTSTTSTETRLRRYGTLFEATEGPLKSELIPLADLLGEPVYQLMRLCLLARCIEQSHEQDVDRARVVYVAPKNNASLWASPGTAAFSEYAAGRPMDEAWLGLVRRRGSVLFMDSAAFVAPTSPTSAEFKHRYSVLAS